MSQWATVRRVVMENIFSLASFFHLHLWQSSPMFQSLKDMFSQFRNLPGGKAMTDIILDQDNVVTFLKVKQLSRKWAYRALHIFRPFKMSPKYSVVAGLICIISTYKYKSGKTSKSFVIWMSVSQYLPILQDCAKIFMLGNGLVPCSAAFTHSHYNCLKLLL